MLGSCYAFVWDCSLFSWDKAAIRWKSFENYEVPCKYIIPSHNRLTKLYFSLGRYKAAVIRDSHSRENIHEMKQGSFCLWLVDHCGCLTLRFLRSYLPFTTMLQEFQKHVILFNGACVSCFIMLHKNCGEAKWNVVNFASGSLHFELSHLSHPESSFTARSHW